MTETPFQLYEKTAGIMAERILILRAIPDVSSYLNAEMVALQVRKIVEGLAFGALSALEHGSLELARLRTKDADKLLHFLNAKGLLRLPAAQDIGSGEPEGSKAVMSGAGNRDLSLDEAKAAFSLASSIIHERHPERLSHSAIGTMYREIRDTALRIDRWLWSHILFLVDAKTKQQKGFLVQMTFLGSPHFIAELTKE